VIIVGLILVWIDGGRLAVDAAYRVQKSRKGGSKSVQTWQFFHHGNDPSLQVV
jgi:hypothetical protein